MSVSAFRNTIKERELDLRGKKIPRIENLGPLKTNLIVSISAIIKLNFWKISRFYVAVAHSFSTTTSSVKSVQIFLILSRISTL
jgi:hypothetical protein